MKVCSRCRLEKPTEDFAVKGDALQPWCRSCCKDYRVENARTIAQVKVLRNFNLTPEQYDEIGERQGWRCALCLKDKPLCVDHDHRCCPGYRSCGRCVRGLLCQSCNRGLGLLGDDGATVDRARSYLGWPKPSRPA